MRTMGAAKFKAQCLAVMDEVQAKREPVSGDKEWEAGGEAGAGGAGGRKDPIFGFVTKASWRLWAITAYVDEAFDSDEWDVLG